MRWARETAGFALNDAAAKLGIREARGVSPEDRLSALEIGEVEPTRPMLVKMAKAYRRPLVTFYMSRPPITGERGEDFRTLPADHAVETDAILDALLRDVRARQNIIRAILEEEDEGTPLTFVGSMEPQDGVEPVARSIADALSFDLREFRAQPSATAAFAYLRDRAEDVGFFVILAGNLGSHHTAIDVETFRGFAIADVIAPFIVINDQDARRAWAFTLLHELTHVWLGQTAISGFAAEREIERFCNDVAGELLLPEGELNELAYIATARLEEAAEAINEFSGERNISRTMVAYKMLRVGMIDRGRWGDLSRRFRQEWDEERLANRLRGREANSGPNYYVVRRHRVGDALIGLVRRMMANGALSTTRAGKVLGVKPKNVEPMISRLPANAAQGG